MKKLMSVAAAMVLCASVITANATPVQKDTAKAKMHKMHKGGHKSGMKKMKKDSAKS